MATMIQRENRMLLVTDGSDPGVTQLVYRDDRTSVWIEKAQRVEGHLVSSYLFPSPRAVQPSIGDYCIEASVTADKARVVRERKLGLPSGWVAYYVAEKKVGT